MKMPAAANQSPRTLTTARIVLVVLLTSLVSITAYATIPGIIGPMVVSGPVAGGGQPRGPGSSSVPQQINHQGVVAVNGQRFNGNGDFKFALVDPGASPPATETYLWTNDGSVVAPPASPTAAVNLPVIDGLFNVRLGESPPMDPIPASVFNDNDIVLRVWFDDGPGGNSEQQLTPDQVLTSVPYAMAAATSPPIGSIIAWHRDIRDLGGTNPLPVPDGWMTCDGQPVIDAESPLDGVTLPNLNGPGRFLRGTGGASGFEQAATAVPVIAEFSEGAIFIGNQGNLAMSPFSDQDELIPSSPAGRRSIVMSPNDAANPRTRAIRVRPINMSMVWIMRVK